MKDIKEVFQRIQEHRKEHRDLNKAFRDALRNSHEYQELGEQIQRLKLKRILIEGTVRTDMEEKMDLLKLHIKEGIQTMSDIALTAFMKGERVELTDHEDNEYEPIFSVRFKKTSNKSFPDKKKA